ncbi:MAG: tyrosine-type recombinase/integrase [Candidatus Peribacteraceae bacterium]|nr:tyrosine-type recombinase/integrase [Candidatus Peribacteraceae bacterium]
MNTLLLPAPAVLPPDLADYVHPFLVQLDSLKTRDDYRSELKLFATWFGNQLQQVTSLDLIAYRKTLEERGLKSATIHKKLSVLRSFFTFVAQAFGLSNPSLCVRLPKVTDESTKAVLSLQEVGRLLAAVDPRTDLGRRDLAILGLLLVNGLRTCEVSRASIGDIHEVEGFTVLRVHGKGEKIADAKLREDVHGAIRAYLETRQDFCSEDPLFLAVGNLGRGRISAKTVQARVRHYLRLASIQKPNLTAHSLRHTCAVLTLSIGKADLVQVQRLLRHSDPKVTMRYVQSLDWLRDNAVDRNPITI